MAEVPRKTTEQIQALARDIVTNKTYAAWDDQAFQNSFALFFMLVGGSAEEDWIRTIGLVYEDWDKQSERSINGYPSFLSAQVAHQADRPMILLECIRFQHKLGIVTDEQMAKAESDWAAMKAKEATDGAADHQTT